MMYWPGCGRFGRDRRWAGGMAGGRLSGADRWNRRRSARTAEKIRHDHTRQPGDLSIHGIPQHQLNMRFVAGEAENLSLGRRDQQIDNLRLFRLAFPIFLEIHTGGKDLNVLQKRPYLRSVECVSSGREPSDQYIHAHSGDDESRQANHLVHLHRARPHSRRNRRGQTTTRTNGGKPVFRHQLALRRSRKQQPGSGGHRCEDRAGRRCAEPGDEFLSRRFE